MSNEGRQRQRRRHATVSATNGTNYRELAAVMTELGFPMFHSSARNNVIRVMYTFAKQLAEHYGVEMSESELMARARSPEFQEVMGQILNRNADEKKLQDS